jgi:hypothetical protein
MGEILTITELAEWLRLSPSQIRTMCRTRSQERMANPLPILKLNGNIRFRREAIAEWLKKVEEAA